MTEPLPSVRGLRDSSPIRGAELLDRLLAALFPALPRAKRAAYLPHLEAACAEFGIVTPARAAAFLAQAGHETAGLTRFVENLNYSAAGLRKTWPKRFSSDAVAEQYARKPTALANYVYANRLGNGAESSGDGWRFRGRGALMITGRERYRAIGQLTGLNLEALPDQAAEPSVAFLSAAAYWQSCGLNELADLAGGDGPAGPTEGALSAGAKARFEQITLRINGGLTGQPERLAYYAKAKEAIGSV